MKKFFAIFAILFLNVGTVFASIYLDANYESDNVWIYQFLEYDSIFDYKKNQYKNLEKDFYDFCYFVDALTEISEKIGKKICFESAPDAADLYIGEYGCEERYIFMPKFIHDDFENLIFTADYNDPHFIVSFLCEKLNLEVPEEKNEGKKIYLLEIKNKFELSDEELEDLNGKINDSIFFYPCGDSFYSPVFDFKGKNCIGFFYSKEEADFAKNCLKELYSIKCNVKEYAREFEVVNECYFKNHWWPDLSGLGY